MKLTRKQLAHALNGLPHPRLAFIGKINPIYKVPIVEMGQVVNYDPHKEPIAVPLKCLTFEFSAHEMD